MSKVAGVFVRIFEQLIPDPYIFAVALTLVTALLAFVLAPHHGPFEVVSAWYDGIFKILEFALQMILILVTGYALASSGPVQGALVQLASFPKTTRAAVTLTFLVSALACWLNWGFGLVVAGLLAREIARRMRIDFGWLVAAAYSGFLVWASGLSSSIALVVATASSKSNFIAQATGHALPIASTVFAPFNLVPVVVLLIALPFFFIGLEPKGDDVVAADAVTTNDVVKRRGTGARTTIAAKLENAWLLNVVFVVAGFGYLAARWMTSGFSLDINTVIFIFFLLGLLSHWTPIAYVSAIDDAAKITGPLLIQYPLYGGIMGIMTTTGLAGVIAQWFLTFSTAATLPFWSYISSIIISLFVPSGGGHWLVQGPFAVPAAIKLGASLPATAMAIAIGEEVANMIQPFWCLPILAIAGIALRRVMAFTAIVFFVALAVFGASLLLLVPR